MTDTLIVNEIFLSIQGEGTRAGLPCTLVRLTGCNLRCTWCDTPYAWNEGQEMSLQEVLSRVAELRCTRVEVTGGEPLCQAATPALLESLCDRGWETLLETNGSIDLAAVDPRVIKIVDFKCPSSGQEHANRWENIQYLAAADEVKFVIADRRDFEFASAAVARGALTRRKCAVIFSGVFGQIEPATLARWLLADCRSLEGVRLGLQLHRMIWPGKERGV